MDEEDEEPPLPKPRHAGVLGRKVALAADGEPAGWPSVAGVFPLECHLAVTGEEERGRRRGGGAEEQGELFFLFENREHVTNK